jgi:Transposase DDE domain
MGPWFTPKVLQGSRMRIPPPGPPDAAQTQRRSPSPHTEDVVQGAELAGIRGWAAAAWKPDLVDRGHSAGLLADLRAGGQARYSNAAVQTSLMLRTAFKLPLRQTEGLLASVLTLMDLTISAPDHTTVSRRAVELPVIQPAQGPHGALHVLIDRTGPAGLRGGPVAGGEAWREVASEMAQTASGGRCRQRHDRGADPDRSGRRRSIPGGPAA